MVFQAFSLLQQDLKAVHHDRMTSHIFDLLHFDGADLKPLPLSTRKAALATLLKGQLERGPLRLSESLTGLGTSFTLGTACKIEARGGRLKS